MSEKITETTLIVSTGQYETCAETVIVRHSTERGLMLRARKLARKNQQMWDNWQGWHNANVAIASPSDKWGNNRIIGGQWCEPANGWLDLDN